MRGLLPPGARYRDRACANSPPLDLAPPALPRGDDHIILRMDKRIALLAPALLLASSFALADDPAKTVRVEIPVQVRTEIRLQRSKQATAAKADRILGGNTYSKRLAAREIAKPRRYVPRAMRLKVKEVKK